MVEYKDPVYGKRSNDRESCDIEDSKGILLGEDLLLVYEVKEECLTDLNNTISRSRPQDNFISNDFADYVPT
uniref:Reverse transcriptase n=1 Tax=Strongyloides papillosus TaxID=174720 RepID=A0A0N5CB17_STREA